MTLLTRFELAVKNDSELRELYAIIFNALDRSKAGSPDWCNALAILDNIQAQAQLTLTDFFTTSLPIIHRIIQTTTEQGVRGLLKIGVLRGLAPVPINPL